MGLLRRKSWWKTILYSRITLGLLLFLSLVVSFAVYNRFIIEREVFNRRLEKEEDLRLLEERKAILEEKVTYLENEQGVEAEIRRHFDVAREGEKVVVFLKKDTEEEELPVLPPDKPELSKWQIFLERLIPW